MIRFRQIFHESHTMLDVKKGDVITNFDGSAREVVEARLEDIIFTRLLKNGQAIGPVMGPTHLDTVIANGFEKENPNA